MKKLLIAITLVILLAGPGYAGRRSIDINPPESKTYTYNIQTRTIHTWDFPWTWKTREVVEWSELLRVEKEVAHLQLEQTCKILSSEWVKVLRRKVREIESEPVNNSLEEMEKYIRIRTETAGFLGAFRVFTSVGDAAISEGVEITVKPK